MLPTTKVLLDHGEALAEAERARLADQILERFMKLGGFQATDPELVEVRQRLSLTSIEVLREAITTNLVERSIERFTASSARRPANGPL